MDKERGRAVGEWSPITWSEVSYWFSHDTCFPLLIESCRWTLVANVVVSRSADQCAKRWQQSLDPKLDRSEWREAEDKVLIDAVHRLGRHWKNIQQDHFPGRSKNCIKNRYVLCVLSPFKPVSRG